MTPEISLLVKYHFGQMLGRKCWLLQKTLLLSI